MKYEIEQGTVEDIQRKATDIQLALVEGLPKIDGTVSDEAREQIVKAIRESVNSLDSSLAVLKDGKYISTRDNISRLGAVLGVLADTKTIAETAQMYCEQQAPYFKYSISRVIAILDRNYNELQHKRDLLQRHSDAILKKLKSEGASEKSLEAFQEAYEKMREAEEKKIQEIGRAVDEGVSKLSAPEVSPAKAAFDDADRKRVYEIYNMVKKMRHEIASLGAARQPPQVTVEMPQEYSDQLNSLRKAVVSMQEDIRIVKNELVAQSFKLDGIGSNRQNGALAQSEAKQLVEKISGIEQRLADMHDRITRTEGLREEHVKSLNDKLSALQMRIEGMVPGADGEAPEQLYAAVPLICKMGAGDTNMPASLGTGQYFAGADTAKDIDPEFAKHFAKASPTSNAVNDTSSKFDKFVQEKNNGSGTDPDEKTAIAPMPGNDVQVISGTEYSDDAAGSTNAVQASKFPQPPPPPQDWKPQPHISVEKWANSGEQLSLIHFFSEMEAHGRSDDFPKESKVFTKLLEVSTKMIQPGKDDGKLSRLLAESIVNDIVEYRKSFSKPADVLDVAQRYSIPFVYANPSAHDEAARVLREATKTFKAHRKNMVGRYLTVAALTAALSVTTTVGALTAYSYWKDRDYLVQLAKEAMQEANGKVKSIYGKVSRNSDELTDDAIRQIEWKVCEGKPNCKVRIRGKNKN